MKAPFSLLLACILFPTASLPALAQTGMGHPVLTAPPATSSAQPPADAAPTAASPVTGDSPASRPDYKLEPDDSIQVTVWKQPTLSGTFPIRPDGMISLPLLGDVKAQGHTPMELSNILTEQLKKYIQDPLVTVSVMAANSQRVYVLGEVAHVGPVEMSASMTPLQAIAAAGGLTPYANKGKIYILRGAAGEKNRIPFNYKKALDGDPNASVQLKAGDTIVVR